MIKRDFHLFLRCLLAASVLTAVFAAVGIGAAVAGMRGTAEVYTPINVAVVDGENSILSRMLIRAVAGSEYISNLLEIKRCDANRAYQGLADGVFAAVIELPENFVNDILVGAQRQGKITLSSAAAAHGEIVESVAAFGELLLAAGQYAVFSGERVMARYEMDTAIREAFLQNVNTQLLAQAMTADSRYFVLTVTDYTDTGLSLIAHYAVSWLAAVLMMSAVMFERLYTADRSRGMLLRLRAVGVSDVKFLIWKILLPFLFFAVVVTITLPILMRWLTIEWSVLSIVCAALGLLVVAVASATIVLCAERGTPILLISTLMGLFLCGGLIPRQMLAQWLLFIGDITPLGVSRGLCAPLFGGELSCMTIIAALFWLSVCPIAVVLRLRRVREKGGVL